MHEVEQCRTWVRSIKLISHLREHHCIVQCLQCHAMPKTWMDPALLQRCETLRSWPPGASEGSSWLSWQTCYIVAWVNSVHRSYRSYIIHYYILLYTIIYYYMLLYTIIYHYIMIEIMSSKRPHFWIIYMFRFLNHHRVLPWFAKCLWGHGIR